MKSYDRVHPFVPKYDDMLGSPNASYKMTDTHHKADITSL